MNLRRLLASTLPLVAAVNTLAPCARADDGAGVTYSAAPAAPAGSGGGGGGGGGEGGGKPKSPFVDVPLTLKPLHFSADVGIGFGTYQDTNNGGHVGAGSNFEAAIGLPFLGEFGARIAQRFGTDGDFVGTGVGSPGFPTGADHFARLFDPVVGEPGLKDFANPEFHLRGSMVDEDVFQLGLETRLTVPASSDSYWAFTPGLPMRIHLPGLMRIDVGLWLPVVFVSNPPPGGSSQIYVLDIPVQAFFQIGDAFVGPESGVRLNNIGSSPTSTDVPLGVGGGYTFGGILDIKAQLRTERINSGSWATQAFGGGLGVGLRVP
jgi:hypothetical protein